MLFVFLGFIEKNKKKTKKQKRRDECNYYSPNWVDSYFTWLAPPLGSHKRTLSFLIGYFRGRDGLIYLTPLGIAFFILIKLCVSVFENAEKNLVDIQPNSPTRPV